jgi:L-cysteine S-thiosulfotransferase
MFLNKRRARAMAARGNRRNSMRRWRPAATAACAALIAAVPFAAEAAPAQPAGVTEFMANCMQCHQVKGVDNAGNIGPILSDMKSRFPDRTALAGIIFDETKRNPLTVMPPFGRNLILTKEQIDILVDFLYSR